MGTKLHLTFSMCPQVVKLWKSNRADEKAKKANQVVANFASILRRKALRTKIDVQKSAYEAKLKEFKTQGDSRTNIGGGMYSARSPMYDG